MINLKKAAMVTMTVLCVGGLLGCGKNSDQNISSDNPVIEKTTEASSKISENKNNSNNDSVDSLIEKYKSADAVPTPATADDLQGYWVNTYIDSFDNSRFSVVAVIDDNMVCYGYSPASDSGSFEEYKIALDDEGWLHSVYTLAYEQNKSLYDDNTLSVLDSSATTRYYVSGNPDTIIAHIVIGDEWYTWKKTSRDEFLKTVNSFMSAASNPDSEVYFKY